MAIIILFRGNLWKMSQQIGVNLDKTAILGYFGLFLDPWKPRPAQKKIFFLTGSFKLWSILKVCTVLKNVLAKTPKIIPRNKKKGHFGPILAHFRAHYSAQSNLKKK